MTEKTSAENVSATADPVRNDEFVFESTAPGAAIPAETEAAADDDVSVVGTAAPAAAESEAEESAPVTTPEGTPAWTYDPARARASAAGRPAALAAPTATPASLGIVGRHRMPGVVVVLTVVTLGLYAIVWHNRVNREMSDFDTRMHVHPGRSTWAVAIPWLLGAGATVYGALLLLNAQTHVSAPFGWGERPLGWILLAGLLVVPYVELLVPFSLLAVAMTAERVRVCEDRVGITADTQIHPVRRVAWLLLPVVGGVVLLTGLQNRLNGVWERVAPPASSRRRR